MLLIRYHIDPERSRVAVEARSSVHPIHSETVGLTGWVDLDDGTGAAPRLTGAHVELAVDRLRSGNPIEDAELQRRMDVRRFPTISGDVTAAEPADDGRWRITGDLTVRGVTRPHDDTVAVERGDGGEIRITGESTFDVRDFGIQPPRILLLRVFPDVRVTIDVVAAREAGSEAE